MFTAILTIKTLEPETTTEIEFTQVNDLGDIKTVVNKMGADFVVWSIQRAIRDRVMSNFRQGVTIDELK